MVRMYPAAALYLALLSLKAWSQPDPPCSESYLATISHFNEAIGSGIRFSTWEYHPQSGLIQAYCDDESGVLSVQSDSWTFSIPGFNGVCPMKVLMLKGDSLAVVYDEPAGTSRNYLLLDAVSGTEIASFSQTPLGTLNSDHGGWFISSFSNGGSYTLRGYNPFTGQSWQRDWQDMLLHYFTADNEYVYVFHRTGLPVFTISKIDFTGAVVATGTLNYGGFLYVYTTADEVRVVGENGSYYSFDKLSLQLTQYQGDFLFDYASLTDAGYLGSYGPYDKVIEQNGVLYYLTIDEQTAYTPEGLVDLPGTGSYMRAYDAETLQSLGFCKLGITAGIAGSLSEVNDNQLGIGLENGEVYLLSITDILFPDESLGCTDPLACNFSPLAETDDGSCVLPLFPYDCGGNCLNDANNNGVCDEFETPAPYNPDANGDGIINTGDFLFLFPLFGLPFEAPNCISPE